MAAVRLPLTGGLHLDIGYLIYSSIKQKLNIHKIDISLIKQGRQIGVCPFHCNIFAAKLKKTVSTFLLI